MRLRNFLKLFKHLVQGAHREIFHAFQRLQPAGNFVERLEGIVLGQFAEHPAQLARTGQRMV